MCFRNPISPRSGLTGEHAVHTLATIRQGGSLERLNYNERINVDFALPEHLPGLLAEIDDFIEAQIRPLERENIQYFDRRGEFARTDLDRGGIPRREWEDLLDEMRRRANAAGLATPHKLSPDTLLGRIEALHV